MVSENSQPVSPAQQIREYIHAAYVEPARRRHETLVTIRAGDVHRALGLKNRVPNVCQVMESRLLEREAGVKISSRQGPPSGRGTTLTITYTVEPEGRSRAVAVYKVTSIQAKSESRSNHAHPDHGQPGIKLFLALRGAGAKTYGKAGGGEKWLMAERTQFYGPDQDPQS
jgi:hypothetical protein